MTVLAFQRFPVAVHSIEAFEELLNGILAAMRSAGGALWADATRAFDDDPSYILLSEWTTPADLDAWEAGTGAAAFEERIDVHLRGDPTRRRFTA